MINLFEFTNLPQGIGIALTIVALEVIVAVIIVALILLLRPKKAAPIDDDFDYKRVKFAEMTDEEIEAYFKKAQYSALTEKFYQNDVCISMSKIVAEKMMKQINSADRRKVTKDIETYIGVNISGDGVQKISYEDSPQNRYNVFDKEIVLFNTRLKRYYDLDDAQAMSLSIAILRRVRSWMQMIYATDLSGTPNPTMTIKSEYLRESGMLNTRLEYKVENGNYVELNHWIPKK